MVFVIGSIEGKLYILNYIKENENIPDSCMREDLEFLIDKRLIENVQLTHNRVNVTNDAKLTTSGEKFYQNNK